MHNIFASSSDKQQHWRAKSFCSATADIPLSTFLPGQMPTMVNLNTMPLHVTSTTHYSDSPYIWAEQLLLWSFGHRIWFPKLNCWSFLNVFHEINFTSSTNVRQNGPLYVEKSCKSGHSASAMWSKDRYPLLVKSLHWGSPVLWPWWRLRRVSAV